MMHFKYSLPDAFSKFCGGAVSAYAISSGLDPLSADTLGNVITSAMSGIQFEEQKSIKTKLDRVIKNAWVEIFGKYDFSEDCRNALQDELLNSTNAIDNILYKNPGDTLQIISESVINKYLDENKWAIGHVQQISHQISYILLKAIYEEIEENDFLNIRIQLSKIDRNNRYYFEELKKLLSIKTSNYQKQSQSQGKTSFTNQENIIRSDSINGQEEWTNVNKLYETQTNDILKMSAMPWVNQKGINFDNVMSTLLMPGYLTSVKTSAPQISFDSFINNHPLKYNILIVGNPGIGKSTILSRIYLERISKEKDILNIYTDARNFSDFDIKADDIVPYLTNIEGISNVPTCLFRGFRIMIDGFDEVDTPTQETIIKTIRKYRKPYSFIVSCRFREFQEKIEGKRSKYMLFEEIFRVNEWEKEISNEYAKKLLSQYGVSNEKIQLFINKFSNKDELTLIYSTPLYLNILLYLYYSDEYSIDSLNDSNLYLLYDRFIFTLHKNEWNRGTLSCRYVEFIEISIKIAKKIYYVTESESQSLKKQHGYVYNDLFNELNTKHINEQSIFSTILIYDQDEDVIRFRHETIYEYFLAKSFLLSLQQQDIERVVEEFNNFYDFYINKFVRAGISAYKENSKHYYNAMCSIYYMCIEDIPELLNKYKENVDDYTPIKGVSQLRIGKSNIEKDLTIRELSVYYCGRLDLDVTPKLLRFVWENDPSLLIRRTAILGLLLNNDEEAEKEYLHELKPGSKHDIMQRSLSLLYFGDAKGSILSFQDDGTMPWTNVRKEIMERLKVDNKRNLLFRFWDLRTLCLFCESRKSYRMTDDEFSVISNCTIVSPLFSPCKEKAIANEKSILVKNILSGNHLNNY